MLYSLIIRELSSIGAEISEIRFMGKKTPFGSIALGDTIVGSMVKGFSSPLDAGGKYRVVEIQHQFIEDESQALEDGTTPLDHSIYVDVKAI